MVEESGGEDKAAAVASTAVEPPADAAAVNEAEVATVARAVTDTSRTPAEAAAGETNSATVPDSAVEDAAAVE